MYIMYIMYIMYSMYIMHITSIMYIMYVVHIKVGRATRHRFPIFLVPINHWRNDTLSTQNETFLVDRALNDTLSTQNDTFLVDRTFKGLSFYYILH